MTQAIPAFMVAAAQDRGAGAFEGAVRRHQAMVFSIAFRFLGDRAHAEDVAQEVFFRLSRHLGSIESEEHLVRWLRKVASRLCVDEIRRRPPPATSCLEDLAGPDADLPDPLASERLRHLVASLPDAARMAIILRYQEDMEPWEIAEALDVSVNTIKSRILRALASLRAGFGSLSAGSQP